MIKSKHTVESACFYENYAECWCMVRGSKNPSVCSKVLDATLEDSMVVQVNVFGRPGIIIISLSNVNKAPASRVCHECTRVFQNPMSNKNVIPNKFSLSD